MARTYGSQNVTTNYEVQVKKPFDARMLVPNYDSLLDKSNWVKSGTTQVVAYNGMIVAVADTTDTSKNGLYFLFDPNCTTALKSPDVTNPSYWTKIGETADAGDIADRLAEITSQLADFEERISALESKEVISTNWGHRDDFPITGEAGILYIIPSAGESYIWDGTDYVKIGGSTYEEPTVICGGSAN